MRSNAAIIVLLLFTAEIVNIVLFQNVSAQFIPIPPPSGGQGPAPITKSTHAAQNDHDPPRIHIITTTLNEGKSVYKVNIEDQSEIASAFVKYVKGGQLFIDPMVSMGGNLYESLIDIHPPSKIIEIQATDVGNNTAIEYAQYNVTSNDLSKGFRDLFGQFWNSLGGQK